jgi:hypothetical protein
MRGRSEYLVEDEGRTEGVVVSFEEHEALYAFVLFVPAREG